MKKKKFMPMLILLLALVALVAVYLIISGINDRKEAEEKKAEEEASVKISLNDYEYDDLSSIEFSADGDSVRLEIGEDGLWHYEKDYDFPVNQDTVKKMGDAIAGVEAERTVDGGNTGDYGLDKPSLSIKVTCNDGSEHSYALGDKNSFNNETYFMADKSIYMITDSLTKHYDCTVDDLILIEDSLPSDIDEEHMTSVEVKSTDGESAQITDSTGLEEFATLLKGKINFKNWLDYNLSNEEKQDRYGIYSEGGDSIIVNYKKEVGSGESGESSSVTKIDASFTIILGSYINDEGDTVYSYSLPSSKMVYSIDAEDYKSIMNYASYEPKETMDTEAENE